MNLSAQFHESIELSALLVLDMLFLRYNHLDREKLQKSYESRKLPDNVAIKGNGFNSRKSFSFIFQAKVDLKDKRGQNWKLSRLIRKGNKYCQGLRHWRRFLSPFLSLLRGISNWRIKVFFWKLRYRINFEQIWILKYRRVNYADDVKFWNRRFSRVETALRIHLARRYGVARTPGSEYLN